MKVLKTIEDVIDIVKNDPEMMEILSLVQWLDLPDCWIGAGFIRNKVWNHIHWYGSSIEMSDIDIIYFDPHDYDQSEALKQSTERERKIEQYLHDRKPWIIWSVANQARMHEFNNDTPYRSSIDAISYWPETATSTAIRLQDDQIIIEVPHGIDDLIGGIVRPTPHFLSSTDKMKIYGERALKKNWRQKWPKLQFIVREQ